MKILQICSKPPFPEVDGGCKAMHALTRGLLAGGQNVKVLTISTPKHSFLKEKLPEEYLNKTRVEHVFIDTSIRFFKAFMNLFSSKSYNLERFYSKDFERLIIDTLGKDSYDIILLETLFVTGYVDIIRKQCNAKIVYRAHNVEHDIWRLNARKENGLKRWYLNFLADRLKVAEIVTINKVDALASITKIDEERFRELGCSVPISTIPFGVDISEYQFSDTYVGKEVFHIGSMDWLPNQTGMKWFLDNVWERVLKEVPESRLNLAGRNIPDWLRTDEAINLIVHGEVDCAVDFIKKHNIMVVPLLAGSGMRIKIIEGMALGKTVIATSIAAEGISYTDNKNILIANTSKEFEETLVYYLDNQEQQRKIGDEARFLMEKNYDNKLIVINLVRFFKRIVG